MINPETTFKKILREYGHDILLQRRISDNFLYSQTFERITTRHFFPSAEALAQAQREDNEGVNTNVDLIFYFESEVNPKQGDRIYEESPSNINSPNLYLIDFAAPVRGRFGKIVYWIAGATRERPI
jgi:hypothetical protein